MGENPDSGTFPSRFCSVRLQLRRSLEFPSDSARHVASHPLFRSSTPSPNPRTALLSPSLILPPPASAPAITRLHKEARRFCWKVIPNWDDIVDLCGKDSVTDGRAETAAHAIELVRKSTADDIVNLCRKDGATVEGVADTATHANANELVQKSTVDDIVDLCGKDKATRERVADESMSDDHISAAHHTEDFRTLASPYSSKRKRGKSSSSSIAPLRKKKAKRNEKLVVAITKLAATFEEYMHVATLKLDAREVYEEINMVKGLGGGEELKACMLFIENEQQFHMRRVLF